jgi:hypothetical protein
LGQRACVGPPCLELAQSQMPQTQAASDGLQEITVTAPRLTDNSVGPPVMQTIGPFPNAFRPTCVNCGARHGGTFGAYCPDCETKSKQPGSDVPPNPAPNPDLDDDPPPPVQSPNAQNRAMQQGVIDAIAAAILGALFWLFQPN